MITRHYPCLLFRTCPRTGYHSHNRCMTVAMAPQILMLVAIAHPASTAADTQQMHRCSGHVQPRHHNRSRCIMMALAPQDLVLHRNGPLPSCWRRIRYTPNGLVPQQQALHRECPLPSAAAEVERRL